MFAVRISNLVECHFPLNFIKIYYHQLVSLGHTIIVVVVANIYQAFAMGPPLSWAFSHIAF